MKMNHRCALLLRALCSALLLALAVSGRAADPKPPGKMAFQGFLTDGNGAARALAAPENITVTFRIYGSATAATTAAVWAESQVVTVDKGHFSVVLGEGSVVTGLPYSEDLSPLFTGDNANGRYLGITVETEAEISPRIQFLAAPYAHLSRYANELVGSSGSSLLKITGNKIGIGLTNNLPPVATLEVNGSVAAKELSGDGSKITKLNGAELATNSVSGAKIVDGTITAAKLEATFSGSLARRGGGQTFSSHFWEPQVFSSGHSANPTAIFLRYPGNGFGAPFFDLQLGLDLYNSLSSFSTSYNGIGGDAVIVGTAGRKLLIQPSKSVMGLTIASNGFIGLGMSTPEAPLHWRQPAMANTGTGWGMLFDNTANLARRAGLRIRDNGDFEISADTGQSEYARLNRNGTWSSTSDARLKKDVAPISGLLAGALNLRPVHYHFKDEKTGSPLQMGFIAQEVQEHFPTLVTGSETLTLNYAGLSVVAIGAIKEMNAVVRQQETELKTLSDENAALTARLERLEAGDKNLEREVAELKRAMAKILALGETTGRARVVAAAGER
jgi:hypothetical protein